MHLPSLSDAELDAEHDSRMTALQAARDTYAADRSEENGRALYDARQAASETQAERNARFGSPPVQELT